MDTDNVLAQPTPAAEPSDLPAGDALETSPEGAEHTDKPEGEAKPEKTPEQRALERAEKKIGRLVRQREELRAQLTQGGLRQAPIQGDNRETEGDSENLTLSRAELDALITKRAAELAPTVTQKQQEVEHRGNAARALAKELGQERFSELTADLADILPAEAQLLVLDTDAPRALLEYLTDPDNEAEARAIARMSPAQSGRAIARLETKLATTAKPKPEFSKAAAPLEATRGRGTISSMPNPTDTKAYIKWANEQDRRH